MSDLRQTILDGIEAFRLTREYVGEDTLPAIEGWSWFDWTQKAAAALRDDREGTRDQLLHDANDILYRWREASLEDDASSLGDLTDETTAYLDRMDEWNDQRVRAALHSAPDTEPDASPNDG